LIVAMAPASCVPFTNAADSSATRFGSSPNERVLMTGLDGLLLTSTTGAKLTLMPLAFPSSAMARPTR
jgi:hypothetical protein